MASSKEVQEAQVKRYHGKSSAMAWQEYQLAHKPEVKGDNGWIKEEKAHAQAITNPKKKQYANNEDPITHPRHKELKISNRMRSKTKQTHRQWQTHEQ